MMARIALCDASGPLTDLLQKLSGDNGGAWLQNLNRMLRTVAFPIWKTIALGTGLKTADEFRGALNSNGFRIDGWGNDILGRPAFKASKTEIQVDLVNVSVAELGFKDGATRADIYKQALELGLELCPNEVGPQLRLQYKDQPKGEWLLIAMEPIIDSDGDLVVFYVGHNDYVPWLNGNNGNPDNFWRCNSRWVFARRKPA